MPRNFRSRSTLLLSFYLILGAFVISPQLDANESTIRYTLHFRECDHHIVEVLLSLPTEGKEEIDLKLPTWTPGSYMIREYSKNIESIQAEDPSTAKPLEMTKISKNSWRLVCPGVPLAEIRYRLYCREMGVRTNWVENDFAFLTGAATFLSIKGRTDQTHEVRVELPSHWRDIATSLSQRNPSETHVRIAQSYDELVDSPLLFGQLDIRSFEVGGKTHYLANALTHGLWDGKKATEDMQKIVEIEQRFWGEVPYSKYWFLNICSETGGGLEHDNSTVLMASRWAMKKRSQYIDWLSLVSHEFFHTWNVRRLRPSALMKYDYDQEQYFPELWIAEGITSYYDDLFVAQAKLCSREEYLERFSKNIVTLQTSAGRLVQPLSDSSIDSWIKLYRPDENASNCRMSYYVKGAVVAWLLDTEIRKRTGGKQSLQDVMKRLWSEHLATGYTQKDFERIVASVVGEEMHPWFVANIEQAQELDYTSALEMYGLRFKTTKDQPTKSNGENGAKSGAPSKVEKEETWLGMDTATVEGKLMVKRIPRGSPADTAGINVDDELLAIDRFRIGVDSLNDRLSFYTPGATVQILVARRGRLIELPLVLGTKPVQTWQLEFLKEPTEEQKRNVDAWLGALETVESKP